MRKTLQDQPIMTEAIDMFRIENRADLSFYLAGKPGLSTEIRTNNPQLDFQLRPGWTEPGKTSHFLLCEMVCQNSVFARMTYQSGFHVFLENSQKNGQPNQSGVTRLPRRMLSVTNSGRSGGKLPTCSTITIFRSIGGLYPSLVKITYSTLPGIVQCRRKYLVESHLER